MGGDHKCPVCQATFTRPQHVARHMRSHTGDRPYKCQYCGDQFARSDLLSRHVNKCHANEKPIANTGNARRKGTASASRATTSKQACDQCVQSSLPCDGCNPCAKCVQRKSRCTFVKFHRQTAPTGPGHNPRPSITSSSRVPIYSQSDDFVLGPSPPSLSVPSMADNLYSQNFAFPPLYPNQNSAETADFAAKYRAQAELLRRPSPTSISYPDEPSWMGWAQQSGQYSNHSQEAIHDNRQYMMTMPAPITAELSYPSYPAHSHRDRRGSVDFGSDGSTNSPSVPSSTTSSTVHLPLDNMPLHHQQPMSYNVQAIHDISNSARGYMPSNASVNKGSVDFGSERSTASPTISHQPLSYNALNEISFNDVDSRHHSSLPNTTLQQDVEQPRQSRQEGRSEFSSAFGLMSLDDPNVLAGLSTDAAPFFSNAALNMSVGGDPNATPMPSKHQQDRDRRDESDPSHHQRSLTMPTPGGSSRESDTRELREFWKQYMRTPLSGPGSGPLAGVVTSPGLRRARVASLPSVKTPVGERGRFLMGGGERGYNNHHDQHNERERATGAEDLRSYEAAVMARKAPTTLSLGPRARRGTGAGTGSASAGTSPQVPPVAPPPAIKYEVYSRPGSSAGLGGDSSLANAFGGQGYGGTYSEHHSPASRESSLSVDDGSGSGSTSGGEMGGVLRPSFKRLPSQTLGPVSAKRMSLSREDMTGGRAGYQQQQTHRGQQGLGQGVQHVVGEQAISVADRRRRMSMPAAAAATAAS